MGFAGGLLHEEFVEDLFELVDFVATVGFLFDFFNWVTRIVQYLGLPLWFASWLEQILLLFNIVRVFFRFNSRSLVLFFRWFSTAFEKGLFLQRLYPFLLFFEVCSLCQILSKFCQLLDRSSDFLGKVKDYEPNDCKSQNYRTTKHSYNDQFLRMHGLL